MEVDEKWSDMCPFRLVEDQMCHILYHPERVTSNSSVVKGRLFEKQKQLMHQLVLHVVVNDIQKTLT